MDGTFEANLYMAYEKRQFEATHKRPVLPVTIVTGFLGAGKTTLLRKILRSKHNLRIATVINEYGLVDHDGGVLEMDGSTDSVEKLAGGCVCCQGSLGSELEEKIGELLRRPDHADDRYDYLVIETSGVTDPDSIVRAITKTFGKLTRARLDSVVTVVDSDALLYQLQGGAGQQGETAKVAVSLRRQIESADVILLNKADLLDGQRLSVLSAKVSAMNPLARILSCSYGQVPVHAVLDVEAPRTDIQGVSHERVKTHLHVSSKGGNLRKASSSSLSSSAAASSSSSVPATASSLASASSSVSSSASSSASSSSDGNKKSQSSDHRNNDHRKSDHGHHLQDDGLEQVTFTSSVPLSLARFQDWVCYGMPAGAVRVKGILAFDEDRLTRSVFNMSGRRRLSFENGGRWEGPMSLYLVVIGVGMDLKEVLTTLEGMRVGASSPGPSTLTRPDCTEAVETAGTAEAADAARFPFHTPAGDDDGRVKGEIARLAALLEEDPLFDMVPRDAEPACAPNVVRFRFTGAGAYGIPPSQLCLRFGVDFNAVNSAILRAVNSGTTTNVNVSRSPFLQQASRHSTALTSPDSSTNTDNSMGRHDAHDLAGSSGTADLGDKKSLVVDPRKSDPVSVASGSEKTIPVPKLFLTSQEGVHLAGDGGGEEECLVLRYAVGSKASLVDAWPMVIDRTREVVKAELGHIHFCNCFS